MNIEISGKLLEAIKEWCKANNYSYSKITIIRFTPSGIILTFNNNTATIITNKSLDKLDKENLFDYKVNDLKFEL